MIIRTHDALGSVTGMVDKGGKLLGIYDYASFGQLRRDSLKMENRYRYTSREFVEDNLYYYRARYMRLDLGRFMSVDPQGMVDGTNLVRYVKNSPVNNVDPSGLKSCSCDGNNNPPLPGGYDATPGKNRGPFDPCRLIASGKDSREECYYQCKLWHGESTWSGFGELCTVLGLATFKCPPVALSFGIGSVWMVAKCRCIKRKCEKMCDEAPEKYCE